MKKVIAVMLTLALLGCLAIPFMANAADTPAGSPISTIEDFIAMDPNGVYYLEKDIDFSQTTYRQAIYAKEFKGILDGNNHALLGIKIEATNSDAGIFANWFSGTLKNLTIGDPDNYISVSSTGAGYSVAAIAGTMLEGAKIENVTIYANVTGDGKTSGISSYIRSGDVTVTNTAVYGSITGNPAAGFFALSNDSSSNVTIKNSFNYATITAGNSSAGGFYTVVANVNGSRSGNLKVSGCANFGAVSATDWRCGGIVGEFHENKASTMTIDYCYNMGAITMKGSGGFAAGIAGGASFDSPSGQRKITNVYNGGEIKNTANAANAFAIAFANQNTTASMVENAAYLDGTAAKNVKVTNAVKASSIDALAEIVLAYVPSEDGNRFVADTANDNGGYPILLHQATTHENVKTYTCGRKVCLDCKKVLSKSSEENHSYQTAATQPEGYLNGYVTATCRHCGVSEVREGLPSAYQPALKDGAYQILFADHLTWYRENLEAGLLSGRETLALADDLDLENKPFVPIGSKAHPFAGKFDGKGHTISNLSVKSESEGGFFGTLSIGAEISMLMLENVTIEANGAAGALFGNVAAGAVVKIDWVVGNHLDITSKNDQAGGLGGSTDRASNVYLSQCAVDDVTLHGEYTGGLVGLGNASEMINCYANAKHTASKQSFTGSLAYYTTSFSAKHSGYVKYAVYGRSLGSVLTEEDFSSGVVAHLINAYSNQKVLGTDGEKITMDHPVYMVRFGEKKAYTTSLLKSGGNFSVYTDNKTVAIALSRKSGTHLTDYPIKLTSGGKVVEFTIYDFTLTRRVTLDDKLYTVDNDTALYVLSLENVTAYEIGRHKGDVKSVTPASVDSTAYIQEEVTAVIEKVQSVLKEDSIVFLASSDSHHYGKQDLAAVDDYTDPDGVLGNTTNYHAALAMAMIAEKIELDFVTFLGDATFGHSTTTSLLLQSQVDEWFALMESVGEDLPRFYAIGNHDTGYYYHKERQNLGAKGVYTETGEYLFNTFTAASASENTVFGDATYGGYCYRDFPEKKLRVFLLNTSEGLLEMALTDRTALSCTEKQRLFVANALSELNEKADAEEWNIIFLSHYPADYDDTMPLSDLFRAYVQGKKITLSHEGEDLVFDFNKNNKAKFVAQFHGHIHNLLASKLYSGTTPSTVTTYDAWRICIPNAQFNRENYHDETTLYDEDEVGYYIPLKEEATYSKTPDTADETAFSVTVVNPSEGKIYVFCYGAGYDRVVSY